MKVQDLLERDTFSTFDEIFHFLMNNCRQALQQTHKPIYRGMGDFERYDRIISPCHRPTMSDDESFMDDEFIKYYDKWMVENFHHPYLSKGLFTTGSKDHSSGYGEVFMVIPIDSFKFVWSPKVNDLIDISERFDDHPTSSYEEFKKYIDTVGYSDKNLNGAINSGHEIILSCGRYFHISEAVLKEWNSEYETLEELWTDLRG